MKKYLAAIAAIAMMTAAFTGCANKNTGSADSSATESTSATESSSASESTSGEDSSSAPEIQERTAKDLTNAVFECVDWVSAQELTDAESIEMMIGLDIDKLEEYSIYVPLMSVHLDELVFVKPKAGSEAEVESQLTDHFNYIKESAAYYPSQEIAAAGSVMGKTDDGFYYLIVNQIGADIEAVIKDYKPGDEVPKLEIPEADYGADGVTVVPTDEL